MIANGDIQNWVNKLEDGSIVCFSMGRASCTIQVYIEHTEDEDKTDRKHIIIIISRDIFWMVQVNVRKTVELIKLTVYI